MAAVDDACMAQDRPEITLTDEPRTPPPTTDAAELERLESSATILRQTAWLAAQYWDALKAAGLADGLAGQLVVSWHSEFSYEDDEEDADDR